jgi:hypothetical protein
MTEQFVMTSSDTATVRLREGGFWLALFMLAILVTASAAEVAAPKIAVDGVSLGSSRAEVETLLGVPHAQGDLDPQAGRSWCQFARRGQSGTTVTFNRNDSCVHVRGHRLSLGTGQRLALGATRADALDLLGAPVTDGTRKGREVMEFESTGQTEICLVLEEGLVVGISAGRGEHDPCLAAR